MGGKLSTSMPSSYAPTSSGSFPVASGKGSAPVPTYEPPQGATVAGTTAVPTANASPYTPPVATPGFQASTPMGTTTPAAYGILVIPGAGGQIVSVSYS
jgi:hypothetical protein